MFAFEAMDPQLPNTADASHFQKLPLTGLSEQYGYLRNSTKDTLINIPNRNTGGKERPTGATLTGLFPVVADKKKKKRGMNPAAPATTVMRGFITPVTSGGEESDFSTVSTPRLDPKTPPSVHSSPDTLPSSLTRAISGLRLDTVGNNNKMALSPPMMIKSSSNHQCNRASSLREYHGSGSDGDADECDTYEIPVGRDFAFLDTRPKPLFGAIEGGLRRNSPHRKMNPSDFEPLKCLGKGAYGTVLLVKQHSTGRLFAQKQLKKATITVHKRLVEQTRNERNILESVNRHPFVVKLFYAFQDHEKLYLILEYAQGGELFHHLAMERTFTEEVSAFYMAEMVLALVHLHRNLGLVYRDLKPENCLLDSEGHLLLTDFGLSKVAVDDASSPDSESRSNSVVGTIDYMAPEVIQGRFYDAAVDWWSLGAVGYDLLTGAPPFSANNHAKIQQKIVHGKVTMPYYLSPDAKDLLTRLLRKEPRKRLGGNMPKDLSIIQGHRFFRKVDWKAMQKRELAAPIQPIITDPAAAENFSTEFTDLVVSPIKAQAAYGLGIGLAHSGKEGDEMGSASSDNVFGGFSFVASASLLDCGEF